MELELDIERLRAWVKRNGMPELMIRTQLSFLVLDRIIKGKYDRKPRPSTIILLNHAMQDDGIRTRQPENVATN